jgi:hypothetical protein
MLAGWVEEEAQPQISIEPGEGCPLRTIWGNELIEKFLDFVK